MGGCVSIDRTKMVWMMEVKFVARGMKWRMGKTYKGGLVGLALTSSTWTKLLKLFFKTHVMSFAI